MSGSDWRKQTKARKTHQCEICRNQILPGEVYIRYDCTPWGHPDNEGYHTYRCCRFCDHMHYDVLQIADEDGTPWWEETAQAIRAHFYEQVHDICGPEIDLDTYADDFSRWTLAGGPFERCVGHPDQRLKFPTGWSDPTAAPDLRPWETACLLLLRRRLGWSCGGESDE